MKLATAVSAWGALVVSGSVLASPAIAAPPATLTTVGTYTFDAEDGETATWTLTACPGDPPGCVRVFESGNPKRASWNGEAHYSVGSWILFVQQSDAILCEDGTTVPGRNTYSWNNVTLSGNVSILTRGACGKEPGNLSIPFTLAKTGPAPMPDSAPASPAAAPPETPPPAQPMIPPAPELIVPLPAESSAT